MRTLATIAAVVVLAHLTGCCCPLGLVQSPMQSLRDLEVPAPTVAEVEAPAAATLPAR